MQLIGETEQKIVGLIDAKDIGSLDLDGLDDGRCGVDPRGLSGEDGWNEAGEGKSKPAQTNPSRSGLGLSRPED